MQSVASHDGAVYNVLMVRISPIFSGNVAQTQRKKKTSESSSGGFASFVSAADDDSVADTASIRASASITAPSSLLGLQEVSDEEVARKQDVRSGFMSLDALEELKMDILTGVVKPATLAHIQKQIAYQRQQSQDPQLNAILDDIELRAEVELAKLEQAQR